MVIMMEFMPHRVIGRIKLDNTEKHLAWGLAQAGFGYTSAFSNIACSSGAPCLPPSFPPF